MNNTDLILAGTELDNQMTTDGQLNPTAPDIKQQKLNDLELAKQKKLEGFKATIPMQDDVLLGMNDADSPITQNTLDHKYDHTRNSGKPAYDAREARMRNDFGYDAVETAHVLRDGIVTRPIDAINNSKNKRDQINYVAQQLGKAASAVTNQDVVDVGNRQTIQKLADMILKPGDKRWEAPLVRGVEPVNLTGRYINDKGVREDIPLNIPIKSRFVGPGTYRPLMEIGNLRGDSVTEMSANDPMENAGYKASTQQQFPLKKVLDKLREKESSGDYGVVNKSGYVGAYQLGAARLADLGFVKRGTKNSQLKDSRVWTGKAGISSLGKFLGDKELQDAAAVEHIQGLAKQLSPSATSMQDLTGKVFAAHLLGANGSKDLTRVDGNGTSGQKYYDIGAGLVGGQSDFKSQLDMAVKSVVGDGPVFNPKNIAKNVASDVGAMALGIVDAAADIASYGVQEGYKAVGRELGEDDIQMLSKIGFGFDKDGRLNHKYSYEKDGTDTVQAMDNLLGIDDTAYNKASKKFGDDADKIIMSDRPTTDKIVDIVKLAYNNVEVVPQAVSSSLMYMMGLQKIPVQMLADATNQHLEARKENNNGKGSSWEDTITVAAGTAVELGTDYVAGKLTFGIGKGLGSVNKKVVDTMFKALPKKAGEGIIAKTISKVIQNSVKIGAVMAEEGPTEAFQETLGMITERMNTEKYDGKKVWELFSNEDKAHIRKAGYMGAFIGVGQHAGGSAVNFVVEDGGNTASKLADKFKDSTDPIDEKEYKKAVDGIVDERILQRSDNMSKFFAEDGTVNAIANKLQAGGKLTENELKYAKNRSAAVSTVLNEMSKEIDRLVEVGTPQSLEAAQALKDKIVEHTVVHNRYLTAGRKLGSRPLTEVDNEIKVLTEALNKTEDTGSKQQLESKLKLLEIEKVITELIPLAEKDAVGTDGKTTVQESLGMKFFGGTQNGAPRTGILEYAEMLLDPSNPVVKEAATERVEHFIRTQEDKLKQFKMAKEKWEGLHQADKADLEEWYNKIGNPSEREVQVEGRKGYKYFGRSSSQQYQKEVDELALMKAIIEAATTGEKMVKPEMVSTQYRDSTPVQVETTNSEPIQPSKPVQENPTKKGGVHTTVTETVVESGPTEEEIKRLRRKIRRQQIEKFLTENEAKWLLNDMDTPVLTTKAVVKRKKLNAKLDKKIHEYNRKAPSQAQKVKDASTDKLGDGIDENKKRLAELFRKREVTEEIVYGEGTNEDKGYLDNRTRIEELLKEAGIDVVNEAGSELMMKVYNGTVEDAKKLIDDYTANKPTTKQEDGTLTEEDINAMLNGIANDKKEAGDTYGQEQIRGTTSTSNKKSNEAKEPTTGNSGERGSTEWAGRIVDRIKKDPIKQSVVKSLLTNKDGELRYGLKSLLDANEIETITELMKDC